MLLSKKVKPNLCFYLVLLLIELSKSELYLSLYSTDKNNEYLIFQTKEDFNKKKESIEQIEEKEKSQEWNDEELKKKYGRRMSFYSDLENILNALDFSDLEEDTQTSQDSQMNLDDVQTRPRSGYDSEYDKLYKQQFKKKEIMEINGLGLDSKNSGVFSALFQNYPLLIDLEFPKREELVQDIINIQFPDEFVLVHIEEIVPDDDSELFDEMIEDDDLSDFSVEQSHVRGTNTVLLNVGKGGTS
jgi:hypothetical protein